MKPFNWTCPYCHKPQTVTEERFHAPVAAIHNDESSFGKTIGRFQSIVCANPDCKGMTLTASLHARQTDVIGQTVVGKMKEKWNLLPDSSAKPQPKFIPLPIREDYYEACKIKELSPKASATLSRRCLQGAIRDFAGIKKGTLKLEIDALDAAVADGSAPKGVTSESVTAIDHVRSIGNIGAHMEKDVNLIINIEPHEAQTLIELIEMLFEEWYVSREERGRRLAKLQMIKEQKDAKKKAAKKGPKAVSARPREKTAS